MTKIQGTDKFNRAARFTKQSGLPGYNSQGEATYLEAKIKAVFMGQGQFGLGQR